MKVCEHVEATERITITSVFFQQFANIIERIPDKVKEKNIFLMIVRKTNFEFILNFA